MKIVLTCYGSRGDVEPSVVVGRELQRRGHDVQMAVRPTWLASRRRPGFRRSLTGSIREPVGESAAQLLDVYLSNPWRKARSWSG